jgi:hypothetical protein
MTSLLAPSSPFKIALIQLSVGADKSKNLIHAREKILEAAKNGANVVVLPVRRPTNFVEQLYTKLKLVGMF